MKKTLLKKQQLQNSLTFETRTVNLWRTPDGYQINVVTFEEVLRGNLISGPTASSQAKVQYAETLEDYGNAGWKEVA